MVSKAIVMHTALTKEEDKRLKEYILEAKGWGKSPNKRSDQSFATMVRAARTNPPEDPVVSLRCVDRYMARQDLCMGVAKPLESVRFDAQQKVQKLAEWYKLLYEQIMHFEDGI